jgi:hypothetical protein
MMFMKKWICLIAVVCSFEAVNVSAENIYKETIIRCGNAIVSLGDAEAALFLKCGQPLYQRSLSYQTLQMTYATDGMFRVVTTRNGMVTSITTAGRAN